MPLGFRGLAIMDPKGREVRFAGYPVPEHSSAIVICHVTTDALRAIGNISHATEDELMAVFDVYAAEIFKAASEQFDNGVHRPDVTLADIQRAAT